MATARTKKPALPKRDRSGYYTAPNGRRLMSVTTIIGNGVPKPALVHWAAREVAQSAVDNIPTLAKVRGETARAQAFDWLRKAAEQKRDAAANLGTVIHDYAEAIALGKPMPEPNDDQRPFVEAYARFVEDWAPEYEATELVVANYDDGWAGTLDWIARIPALGPALVMGDYKTGKGVYGEAGLQMAAYRRATVGWLKDGTEVEVPPTESAVVVHIRPGKYPDRGYALLPVDTSDAVYASFLSARDVAQLWVKGLAETVVGAPLELPAPTTAEVA